ncbi:glycerophosphoryl diester phosphodiesterase membrane domain-containing protein [Lacticaseibacillus mingshuiensis]|uniref:Glycerophosphoryl diester phosphodiesterase membrane domain-containing protein n=1 Tax=Lacticaseibacillus mingshuiensis TaxID=2799574 RepID=A0ABW4CG33_9LACO|nr:glycerophosphodiester phosphodiesterase [Lacticaseibacillus mingshuiensis]
MNSFRYSWRGTREFWAHWWQYLALTLLTSLVLTEAVIPLLRWVTQTLLSAAGIPFLSYNNLGGIVGQHPLVAAGLVVILLMVLLLAYLQFTILLIGVANIRSQNGHTWRQLLRETLASLRHLRLGTLGFFLVYFLLIVPFAGQVLASPLLSKLTIPAFIIEYVTAKPVLLGVLVAFYLGIGWLGLRLLRTLPLALFEDISFGAAAKRSWTASRGRLWFYFRRILWLSLIVLGLNMGWSEGLIALQTWLDTTSWAFAGAMGTTTLLMGGAMLLQSWATVLFVLLLLTPETIAPVSEKAVAGSENMTPVSGKIAPAAGKMVPSPTGLLAPRRKKRWLRLLTGIVIGGAAGSLLLFNFTYLNGMLDTTPLTISHRGVDDGNGVQNTIPALQATSKEHPDFVEMDIHETKDDQFVVMHDENLKALTGLDRTPRQVTLAQATQLTARENGHRAKVASFDAYLAAAEQLHQKLIVEVKTTTQDSVNAIDLFIDRYGQRLIADGSRVHSLDYRVVSRIKQRLPKLYTSFILPYLIVMPRTPANAYTVEETTLSAAVAGQIQAAHKAVWVWTVNDADQMTSLMFESVDGIITDRLALLQQTIKTQTDHPSYAARLRNLTTWINMDTGDGTIEN